MKYYENIFDDYKINTSIVGLTLELRVIYVYNLFVKKNNSILFVANTLYEANNIYQSLKNYTNEVLLFPMDDFLTSEALAISPELKISRLETLNELTKNNKKIIVTNLMGYRRFLPSPKLYKEKKIVLKSNMDYDIKQLVLDLFDLGYTKETIISKTGEMGVRGFVMDIFPIGYDNPIRIEFWGDVIDTIKTFDVDNQRTIADVTSVEINPNTEFLCAKDVDFEQKKQKNLYKYTSVSSILDYIDDAIVVFDNYSEIKTSDKFLEEEIYNYNLSLQLPTDNKYMLDFSDIKSNKYLYFETFDKIDNDVIKYNSLELLNFTNKKDEINKRLNDYLKHKKIVIICIADKYKINKIEEFLENKKIVITNENNIKKESINLICKKIYQGFEFNNYIVISEKELFNKQDNNTKYKTNFKMGSKIKDITKLELGDYIVHSMYGIGRYTGIKTLNKNGFNKDYLQLEYKGGDKLYIPVEKIELISKYSSNECATPKINSLNSSEWEKTKLRVKKKIEDITEDLLKLYASREASKGYAFSKDTKEQYDFEKEFTFNETADQLKVVEEIKRDMESNKPMDRLLCGDVGYGKTEVAFRAIFKAIMSNKQVAFLCPTTILSNQHYKNALERFSNYAVNIKLLNRFVTKKQVSNVLKDLKEGKIDILIGTHRILSEDIIYKDLGLLIIDEEQRFGVKHKEKIKQYKNNIDVLTLSATPIPRTLQMTMAGIRSLSLIETPPINRYPVQTYVLAYNKQVIKDAIYKELSRNGQIFVLYNNVVDMERKMQEIKDLVPEANIIYAHGQMDKTSLENVMLKFINKEYDILLCTTIIETGIDIPNVNTLIIMDADHFGLSQLYQIRGRVGRSERIAYCYLMYDNSKILSEIATKRLKVIKDFTELGSGFSIAMRDLSIRGAGDFLGSEQSGFIDSVGIELFMQMLKEEMDRINGIEVKEENHDNSLPLVDVETVISNDYVDDEELKIIIHKKINEIDSYEKLLKIKEEISDRFGSVNETLNIYMHEEWFEKMARKLYINKIRQTANFIEVTLSKEMTEKIRGDILFSELTAISRMFRFSTRYNQLIVTLDIIKLDKHFIYYLIDLVKAIEKAYDGGLKK